MKRNPGSILVATLAFGGVLATAIPAVAQISGDGYLFQEPVATLSIHGGLTRPSAQSELFAEVTNLLTIDRGDFAGLNAGANLSVALSSRIAIGLGVDYSSRTTQSEYRDWVDMDDLPIEQSTNFVRVPVLASARFYLAPRGRSVGSFAWIPRTVVPYVGAGAGAVWYRFYQDGDFVDYVDNSIYTSQLESSGWAPAAKLFAGAEYSITPRLLLTGETGYTRSKADLENWFDDFDRIDLSGFSANVGVSFRI